MINSAVVALVVATSLSGLPYTYQTYSTRTPTSLGVRAMITPNSGWKWNTKYPSRFKVRSKKGTSDVWRSFQNGELTLNLAPDHNTKDIEILADFSICNDTTCRVMRGQQLRVNSPQTARKCQTCHGKSLKGKNKNPAIRGLSYEKIYVSLTSDVPKKMKRVASKLTDDQKADIAKYISSLGAK